ncbi:glutaredoxin [Lactarius vividus]|nr:glutaredoxin [Lactarius vividus]
MSVPTPKDINAINNGQVVIFSKSWCPYSKKAKDLIKDEYSNAELTVLELDERDDGDDLQAYLLVKTKQRTVPNIFIKQKHVGDRRYQQASRLKYSRSLRSTDVANQLHFRSG